MSPRKRARTAASAPDHPNLQFSAELKPALAGDSFASLYNAGELCDGVGVHKGTTKPVCCMALAAAATFCKAAFCRWQTAGVKPRVTLDASLSTACVEALLRFAHTGTLDVVHAEVEGLLVAADQLDFPSLVPAVTGHLKATLTPETCISRLALAARHSADALGEAAARMAGEHWAAVAASPAFLALDRDALTLLLAHDELSANEVEIYEAMLAWHGANGGEFAPLLELIRLSELGAAYLAKNVMHSALVKASPRAEEFVQEASIYLMSSSSDRAALASARTRPRFVRLLTASDIARVEGKTLVVGSIPFRVLPEEDVGPEDESEAQYQGSFSVPDGWRLAATSDADFELVRTKVIAPYEWGTDVVIVANETEGEFSGYNAKHFAVPGNEYGGAGLGVECTGGRFKIVLTSLRLLIRPL
jgi:hypothetical protein